ncbi:MAG: N-acetylmuramoyl-L-alanine amidase [Candidatus Taylorbacteria bacterium]|nr:N-acetylmuramoyl-L-alanine amidase [Candidatus Taylorbacteria bacterium]
MKNKIILSTILIIFLAFYFTLKYYPNSYVNKMINSATAFFSMGISINDLISKYSDTEKNGKIKILLVPGHEPSFGGAEYKNLLERDLNLTLSEKIKNILSKNNKFEIITSRNINGWNPELEKYVNNNKNEILVWINNMKSSMSKLVNNGKVNVVNAEMGHSIAPLKSAIFLYGINKWAGENKIDIAIHLHFNDNPKYKGKPNYEGFTIYVPEKQYSNGTSSKILAKDLFDEISKIQKVSTMPEENGGIIEDQELIALGRYNTSDSLSVIIEYAYIYESLMQNVKLRNDFIEKSASSTANAINKFFESRI